MLILDISINIVLAHVVSFPTNLVSLNSESVCKSCGCFGKGCSGTTATRADVIFYYRSRAVLPRLLSVSTAPEQYYRGSLAVVPLRTKNSCFLSRWTVLTVLSGSTAPPSGSTACARPEHITVGFGRSYKRGSSSPMNLIL